MSKIIVLKPDRDGHCLWQACSMPAGIAETAIRFCMAYVTQDKRYFLEDERLYLLKILKRPAIKDDYVEPKPEIPENGMARLAMLGRKGIKAHG